MTFYKIIRDGEVVDAAFTFLQWNERHSCMMACEPRDAQFVQSYDGESIYRVAWLNPVSGELAERYETVETAMIDRQEYEDLRAVLDDGETVPLPPETEEPPDKPPEEPPEEPEEPGERPMTVQEMRDKIREQEEMLQILTECVLEMSEVIYAG